MAGVEYAPLTSGARCKLWTGRSESRKDSMCPESRHPRRAPYEDPAGAPLILATHIGTAVAQASGMRRTHGVFPALGAAGPQLAAGARGEG
ncbi:MAG: hypothetical protein AAFU79_16470, partial [Myxococcota bacterium]